MNKLENGMYVKLKDFDVLRGEEYVKINMKGFDSVAGIGKKTYRERLGDGKYHEIKESKILNGIKLPLEKYVTFVEDEYDLIIPTKYIDKVMVSVDYEDFKKGYVNLIVDKNEEN